MTPYLRWLPLATILGLATSLAITLARPAPTVVIMTFTAPPAATPLVIENCRSGYWPYAYAQRTPSWCW